ncbi:MAG TPA: sigma-70 family RNA polymerase sigma factor [Gammaproteobacteria bacterium]|nr:sigma-70 family RNA polymerase sigma factor [Gammaproteobacteria bacterium]HIK69495.1 sigma-70 family RNA polymerase sigma factor [Pseudomonadales bacterium]|tara:strand:+ start:1239 stop:1730 length:492 start_codon:yes stop_codon:yes gene_type:complete
METDEQLVLRTLTEGNHYYGILIQRHADYLFGLGMRLTTGRRELAEDISQQAFLKSYTYLKSFNSQKSFKHWLTGIAINCYRDMIRKENQYTSLEPANEAGYTPELQCNKDFYSLISPLNNDEKVIFILKYIYEHQTNEIADLVNMKAGTVKSKISRAMEKLK